MVIYVGFPPKGFMINNYIVPTYDIT